MVICIRNDNPCLITTAILTTTNQVARSIQKKNLYLNFKGFYTDFKIVLQTSILNKYFF